MEQNLSKKTRTESDLIGSREVPESALYGVQTLRGIENFRISKFHLRSEERRVGKECRSRWSPYH